jgi:hypothetical protein
MRIYLGIKQKAKPTIFESEEASKQTHPEYDIIFGPFKTREAAEKYVAAMDQGVACSEG